ncbi:MAG: hypothetical protein IJT44_05360 [Clostridia bacterium]|nr:hypothetical protein [Clostridia bacterium]
MKKTVCPKCGGALRLWNWRPDCPHCGVNMTYYDMEARLSRDADAAEIDHAHFQPHLDRIKASFIGAPKAIVRLVCSILPIGALMLPLAKLRYTEGFSGKTITFRATDVVGILSFRARTMALPQAYAAISLALLTISALCLLAHLVGIVGGCTKKGKRFLLAADGCMALLAAGALCAFPAAAKIVPAAYPAAVESLTIGVGAFVYLALVLLCLAADIWVIRSGIPVQYTTCYIRGVPSEEYFATCSGKENVQ